MAQQYQTAPRLPDPGQPSLPGLCFSCPLAQAAALAALLSVLLLLGQSRTGYHTAAVAQPPVSVRRIGNDVSFSPWRHPLGAAAYQILEDRPRTPFVVYDRSAPIQAKQQSFFAGGLSVSLAVSAVLLSVATLARWLDRGVTAPQVWAVAGLSGKKDDKFVPRKGHKKGDRDLSLAADVVIKIGNNNTDGKVTVSAHSHVPGEEYAVEVDTSEAGGGVTTVSPAKPPPPPKGERRPRAAAKGPARPSAGQQPGGETNGASLKHQCECSRQGLGSQPVVNGAPPSTFTSPNISSILNATDPGAMPSLADQPPVSPRRDPIPRYTTTTLPATYRSTVREFVSSNTAVFRTSTPSPGINDATNRLPPFGGPTVRSQSPRWRAAPAAPPVTAAVGVAAPTTAVPGQRPTFESPKVRHYSPGMASTDGFPRTRLTSLDPPDRHAPPRPGPTAAPTVLLATPRASPARSDAPASPGRPGAPGPPAAPASRSPRRPSLQDLEEEIKARAAALPPYCVTSGMAQQPSAYFSSLPAPSSARPATMTSSLPTQREGGFQSPYRMSPNVTRVSVLQPSSSPVRTYRYSSADAGPVRSSPYDAPLAAHPPGPAPPTYASSPVRTVRMASYSSPLRAGYSSTTSILTPSLSPLSGIATPSHQSSPLRLPRGYAYPMSTS